MYVDVCWVFDEDIWKDVVRASLWNIICLMLEGAATSTICDGGCLAQVWKISIDSSHDAV